METIEHEARLGHVIKVYRSGFPINFDQGREKIAANDIQLTRALMLSGMVQALGMNDRQMDGNPRCLASYKLDSNFQRFIVKRFQRPTLQSIQWQYNPNYQTAWTDEKAMRIS